MRLVAILLVLVGPLPWSVVAQPSAVELESITISEWADVFYTASASLQLTQLYATAPRVRAKVFVATSITMAELLSGDAIFRQRISEIVDVAVERVLVEYVETAALKESDRASWALSLGISALIPPPLLPNTTLLMSTVDTERTRILARLLYGNIVRGTNVTIESLQLFGVPMRLLSAHLEGELFAQIDTTPWVGVKLGFATASASDTATNVTSTAVTNAATTSSSAAFQNLRLRFLLVHFLKRLQLDTSSILVRDAVALPASEAYGVPAMLLPIELHVGDNWSVQGAVDGYLRNASLAAALHDIDPHRSLLAIDVAVGDDTWRGNGWPTNLTASQETIHTLAIELRVDALPLAHVQRRAPAILDTVRPLVSRIVSLDSVEVTFGRVTMVSDSTRSASSVTPLESGFFVSSGGHDADGAPPPIDRPFIVRIVVLYMSRPMTTQEREVGAAVAAAVAATSARLALGFLDPFEHNSTSFTDVRVRYLRTTSNEITDRLTNDETANLGSASVQSYVSITLVVAVPDDTADVKMDRFMLYRVRCALLAVLERVLLSDKSLFRVHMAAQADLTVELVYFAQVEQAIQRNAVQQAVLSGRLRSALERDASPFLLIARSVDLHADGSHPDQFVMPGTASVALVEDSPPAPSVQLPRGAAETIYGYGYPQWGYNPSVRSDRPPSCPSPLVLGPLVPRYYGCLTLRWSTEFPPNHDVFVQSISVTTGVVLQSTNLGLPKAANGTAYDSSEFKLYAPSISQTWDRNGTQEWALQFLSSSVQNVTVKLELGLFRLYDNPSVSRELTFATELRLADTQMDDATSTMQIVSSPRANILLPAASERFPRVYASRLLLATNTTFSAGMAVTLAHQASLAFFNSTAPVAAWSSRQSSCLECHSPIAVCSQLTECVALSQCFDRHIRDPRPFLYNEFFQQPNATFDASSVLRSCLSSSTPREVFWSSKGRAAFTTSLQCLIRSACAIASSPSREQFVVLQYAPRQQVIRLVPAHFPLALSFLLDINGGDGASPDGLTRTRSAGYIPDTSSPVLLALRELVLELYGDFARGMDVVVTVSDTATGVVEIRVEYWFLDIGLVDLPFVSVIPVNTADPAPVVETTSDAESLQLISTDLAG